jgi:hypothetical protein
MSRKTVKKNMKKVKKPSKRVSGASKRVKIKKASRRKHVRVKPKKRRAKSVKRNVLDFGRSIIEPTRVRDVSFYKFFFDVGVGLSVINPEHVCSSRAVDRHLERRLIYGGSDLFEEDRGKFIKEKSENLGFFRPDIIESGILNCWWRLWDGMLLIMIVLFFTALIISLSIMIGALT